MATITKDLFSQMREEICGVESTYVDLKNGYGVHVIQLNTEGALALSAMKVEDESLAILNWAAACCVDDDMNPVFTVEDLLHLPNELTMKLTKAVAEVNGFLSKEAVDDAEKNSEEVAS